MNYARFRKRLIARMDKHGELLEAGFLPDNEDAPAGVFQKLADIKSLSVDFDKDFGKDVAKGDIFIMIGDTLSEENFKKMTHVKKNGVVWFVQDSKLTKSGDLNIYREIQLRK